MFRNRRPDRFDRSTVWRGIERNGAQADYQPHRADWRAELEGQRPRLKWIETRPWIWAEVQYLLGRRLSRQQISARDHHGDADWSISHESIYQAVFAEPNKVLRITDLLNSRPRHGLDWDTPAERFDEVFAA